MRPKDYKRMKQNFFIFFTLIVISSNGQSFTGLYGDYLGQTLPGDTAVIFASGIISRSSTEHSAAIFSPDCNEVYWCSRESFSNGGKTNMLFIKRINNRWIKPSNLAPYGDSVNWMDPFLSKDGNRLYFTLT